MAGPPDGRRPPGLRFERRLWRSGHAWIAGLDEVGRGAWAGPVAAGAVVLPRGRADLAQALADVRDSKMMPAADREASCAAIHALAEVGLGWSSAEEVDRLGLIPATRLAMQRALVCLGLQPEHLLIDHVSLPAIPVAQTSITFGDRRSLSIAAASVVAKVARDRAMQELDEQYPGYGFAHHKGYGTPEHQACLRLLGPSPAHRVSFAPIAQRRLPGLEMPLAKRAEARP